MPSKATLVHRADGSCALLGVRFDVGCPYSSSTPHDQRAGIYAGVEACFVFSPCLPPLTFPSLYWQHLQAAGLTTPNLWFGVYDFNDEAKTGNNWRLLDEGVC